MFSYTSMILVSFAILEKSVVISDNFLYSGKHSKNYYSNCFMNFLRTNLLILFNLHLILSLHCRINYILVFIKFLKVSPPCLSSFLKAFSIFKLYIYSYKLYTLKSYILNYVIEYITFTNITLP